MPPLLLGLLVLAWTSSSVSAQVSDSVAPVFHGALEIRPARGSIDPATGTATVKVRSWRFLATPASNGIYPDQEPVIIAIGESTFTLPPGAMRAARKGRLFSYRASRDESGQPIRALRLRRRPDGSYLVRFKVRGVDLSRLVLQDPVCLPTAVLIGDDDGFSGVQYSRPGFNSRRLRVPGDCPIGNEWPWV